MAHERTAYAFRRVCNGCRALRRRLLNRVGMLGDAVLVELLLPMRRPSRDTTGRSTVLAAGEWPGYAYLAR